MTELPSPTAVPSRSGFLDRSLSMIERVGNALPHPGTLFALMALLIVIASGIAAQFQLSVVELALQEVLPSPLDELFVSAVADEGEQHQRGVEGLGGGGDVRSPASRRRFPFGNQPVTEPLLPEGVRVARVR